MLHRFHALLLALVDCAVPVLAAVRGQCLGGGLELVSLCHRIFAAPDARLGQPEIVLGVFAPVASLVLPERVGRRHAEDLCLSGRTVDGARGPGHGPGRRGLRRPRCRGAGLGPPEPAPALGQRACVSPSARCAAACARAWRPRSPAVERLYLDGLMSTARRGRGAAGLPREAHAGLEERVSAGTLAGPAGPGRRSSTATTASARCASGSSAPAGWPSATCRSTSRASCCTPRASCPWA